MYDLHSEFDMTLHKVTYFNYLEVVIGRNGKIYYAVPSHQEKLIKVACDQLGITRDDLNKMCPMEYYCNFLEWLCMLTGYISVWDNYLVYDRDSKPTTEQIRAIQDLHDAGLYKGDLLC